jgi:superfamily I DNA/RNA helicase/RecB family exonuclease
MPAMAVEKSFDSDPDQSAVLDHTRGPLLVTGPPGSGKTWVLRERFARLIENGADAERVALVVRTRSARQDARSFLLQRLRASLPGLKVLTVHGLANHVISARFEALGYDRPPGVLSAADQFSKVQELLAGEDPADWPTHGSMLGLRGFADEVRQFLLRAQEALLTPESVLASAQAAGLDAWRELALFYRRYLEILGDQGAVDFAGLVNQAAVAAGRGEPQFDHVLVDDYQDTTFATEKLLQELRPGSLVVAGEAGSHVFSFQGTTGVPLKRFLDRFPSADSVTLRTQHRAPASVLEAWFSPHTSEEHAAVARELRRIHIEEHVPWRDLAVAVRRQDVALGGLLRALDDAGVPRSTPEGGLSLVADPATHPFVLALRWLARPGERDGLIEPLLTSDLSRLSPAAARGLLRAAAANGQPPAAALERDDGLEPHEAGAMAALRRALDAAGKVAHRSVLDAFSELWRRLPYSRRLVDEARAPVRTGEGAHRDLDAVVAFSQAVARAGEQADASVEAFLEALEAGQEGPGPELPSGVVDAVKVLTAHGTSGLEFDTLVMVGTVEGNFPSLSRPEPMFDLGVLEQSLSQSDRNRLRLEDERRLFHVVTSRARRRVLFAASDPHPEDMALTARSRFVTELGVGWRPVPPVPDGEPLSVGEAAGVWRRSLADPAVAAPQRLAALDGLLSLEVQPQRWWFQRDWTGTARPLHEHVRVSYSKLDKLDNCALQFVLSEELGLEGEAGYYAWVGHLVHKLIEDFEAGRIERTEEALVRTAQERWRPQEFPSHAVSEAFRRTVTQVMLPAWFREYGQTPALDSELHFEFEFQGAQVTGYIDRVGAIQTGGTQITDYKTGKARDAKAEDSLQLGIYYLAVSRAEELERFRPVKAVELAFLRDIRHGSVHRVHLGLSSKAQHEYEEVMAERLTGLVRRVGELQVTENYRPNPRAQCRFCDFKSLCPLWPEGKALFPVARGGAP